jgi:hypothetical protein
MTTPASLAEEHRILQVQLTERLAPLLAQVYLQTIDPLRLDATFPVYLASVSKLLGVGRAQSDALARRYYMRAASLSGATPDALAEIALSPILAEQVAVSLRVTGVATVKQQVAKGVPLEAAQRFGLAATIAASKRIILDGGREMLIEASRRDRNVEGWARITDGSSCAFCAMLVSRGPVYSEKTVSFRSHDRCGCGVRLVFKSDRDAGWSPQSKALRRLWNGDDDPERETGSTLTINEWRTILAEARKDPELAAQFRPPTRSRAAA